MIGIDNKSIGRDIKEKRKKTSTKYYPLEVWRVYMCGIDSFLS